MATVTPNFNWPVPTSTDLVKDGATAIEALGDSIDGSLVDLKGGTTGQVLSKTSGTDMDFTWVTTDDANAIQNSIVDAKGDLIAATANDTPARLAVGTNGQVLTADSTTATGLAWAASSSFGTWTSFTPTWTNLTPGNGTVTAKYVQNGKVVNFRVKIQFGSTTSISGSVSVNWPVAPASTEAAQGAITTVVFEKSGVGPKLGQVNNSAASTTKADLLVLNVAGTYTDVALTSSTVPFTWATNDQIYFQGTYEVA
jgi:hypothetical protein